MIHLRETRTWKQHISQMLGFDSGNISALYPECCYRFAAALLLTRRGFE
jgi:hypothetical protein